jgi:hypothetical protein
MAGASPAMSSPAANSTSPITYGRPGPRRSASRPATTMPTTLPSMNALNTQPSRDRPPRSRATSGMTVTTASASEAMNVMVRARPVVSARRWPAHRPPPSSAAPSPPPTAPAGSTAGTTLATGAAAPPPDSGTGG